MSFGLFSDCKAGAQTSEIVQISDLSLLKDSNEKPAGISVSAAGRDYQIILTPSSAVNHHPLKGGRYFQGKVAGDPDSWVRLSYDGNDLSGYLKAYGELLELQPHSNGANPTLKRSASRHFLHDRMTADRILYPPPRSTSGMEQSLSNEDFAGLQPRTNSATGKVSRVLRLSIVVDSRFDEFYEGKGLEKAQTIINAIDGLYQEQFGLALQLDSAHLLTADADPFRQMDGDIETILREFRRYTLNDSKLSDDQGVVHLFSGSYDSENIIGLSWINSVCRDDGYNVSVSTPFSRQMLLTAHEIGHNLGAVHDDDASCHVEYDKVMWPNISNRTDTDFSGCSKDSIIPRMSASCNLDNIDLGISLQLVSKQQKNKYRTVRVQVSNKDTDRAASEVVSVTSLPAKSIPSGIPKQCSYFADTLTCNHGEIAPASTSKVQLDLTLNDATPQIISSELEFQNFADISRLNNYASLDINSAQSVPDSSDDDDSQTLSPGSGGGIGGIALLSFLLISYSVRLSSRAIVSHAENPREENRAGNQPPAGRTIQD